MRSCLILFCALLCIPRVAHAQVPLEKLYAPNNLMAWCIVPFDAKKRGPVARVQMLKDLGFTKYAYDWRAEHLPTFELEIAELQKAKIAPSAVWFPATIGKEGQFLLETLKKHAIKTELWVMLPQPDAKLEQEAQVKTSADLVRNLAQLAAKQGCKIGIYNHGGWTGEPANMAAIVKAVNKPNVGIVYNLHHGHEHLKELKQHLLVMKPYLYAVNLNGMDVEAEKKGQKILPLGEGSDDAGLIRTIQASGYAGPIGILGHTNFDAAETLADNLAGLHHLLHPETPKAAVRTSAFHAVNIRILPALLPNNYLFHFSNFTRDEVQYLGKNKPNLEMLQQVCPVYVVPENAKPEEVLKSPPLLGTYSIETGGVQFLPRFPLAENVRYRIYCDRAKLFGKTGKNLYAIDFIGPSSGRSSSAKIVQVYPTRDTLPENTLRMYLHFNAPMQRGGVYEHLQLLNEDGKPVKFPFLELDEELWSADGKRFTLLFDPGRVKRGLKPREEDGPILEEGKKFTLVVSKNWKDSHGLPMTAEFRKSFRATKPDDAPVDPAKWKLTALTGDKLFLQVDFEKPLDHALSLRMIVVHDSQGQAIDIRSISEKEELGVSIAPMGGKWLPGKYKLIVDTRLEDVCGNRVGEAFEIDVLKPIPKKEEKKFVEIPFEVK